MDEENKTINQYADEILYGDISLKNVPEKYLTKDLCLQVLEQRPFEIEHVPKEFITTDEWEIIVRANPSAIQYLPREHHTREIFLLAATIDGMSLRYIPSNRRSIVINKAATNNNLLSSVYVKDSLLHHVYPENNGLTGNESLDEYILYYEQLSDRLKKLYDGDTRYKRYRMYEEEYNSAIEDIARYVMRVSPENINNDLTIIEYQRLAGLRYFIEKRYDVHTNLFLVTECVGYDTNDKEIHQTFEFSTYQQFYDYLGGDMQSAELYDYDFKGLDVSEVPLDGVRLSSLSSEALYNLGLFDDTYYKSIMSNPFMLDSEYSGTIDTKMLIASEDEPTLNSGEIPRVINAGTLINRDVKVVLNDSENPIKLYYVSDIHLDHKIWAKFPKRATKEEVFNYIETIVKQMIKGVNSTQCHLIVLGDVSSNATLVNMFYKTLERSWRGKIIAVLGNHELWGYGLDKYEWDSYGYKFDKFEQRHQDVIDKYRFMLSSSKIELIESGMISIDTDEDSPNISKIRVTTYSENMLREMTDDEISDIYSEGKLLFFGGIGYSGYNPSFNASHNIYRDAVPTIEKDIELTERFNNLYERVKRNLSDRKVFVLTHTPKQDWSDTPHNSNWVYMNGHTHQNTLIKTDDMTIYADNQIGYDNEEINLKSIEVDMGCDIFEHLPDGKYTISREEYIRFNKYKGMDIEFNNVKGLIHMLKRENIYMFFYVENKNNRLYLLYGGRKLNIDNQSMEYYYNNMVDYVNRVEYQMGPYYRALKQISNMVKSIGGSGHIHGSIVDIDYYNHIYLNLSDGKVTPYYAESVVDKDIYPDIPTLLKERCPEMLDKYLDVAKENDMLESIKEILTQEYRERVLVQKVYDTSMYKPSNKIFGLQYMTNKNIIRVWYDDILKDNSFDSLMLE